jgi:hypothetical protein
MYVSKSKRHRSNDENRLAKQPRTVDTTSVSLEERDSIRKNRSKSPEAFLKYMCYARMHNPKHMASQRANSQFYQHCLDLYKKQEGRCALTGIPMTYIHGNDIPTNISIDRLDNDRGYEIGNVRLVLNTVNFAISMVGDRGFLPIAAALLEHFGGYKVIPPNQQSNTQETKTSTSPLPVEKEEQVTIHSDKSEPSALRKSVLSPSQTLEQKEEGEISEE